MKKSEYSLQELAELTQSKLICRREVRISNVADLESAGPYDASFFKKTEYGQASRYEKMMQKSAAGVIFIHPETPLIEDRNFLLNEDPSRAFQTVLELINGSTPELSGFESIHPTAVIHPSAKIGQNVTIGPQTVIDKEVVIGEGSHIGAGCYIGPHTKLGTDCVFHPRVTIREKCVIGNRVVVQPGAVIGSCGFGYTTDKGGQHRKLNQIGNVVIEDDVEIGANTAIDRGRFKSTIIGKGTKIDNLVQIGHGCKLGPHNLIVSQTGLAGSTETGNHVVMGGQCGISGHLKIGNRVILSARTGVDKSLPDGGTWGGAPAQPMAEHNRTLVFTRKIEKFVQQLKALEKRIGSNA